MTFSVPYEILLAAEKIERWAKENNHEAFRIGNVVFADETMTTREEAEHIAETADVAAALRYLVDSHSENAAVDVVQAVMDAVVVTDLERLLKKLEEKLGFFDLPDCSDPEVRARVFGRLVEEKTQETAPNPSKLVQAVDNLLKVFDETDPEINCYLHGAIDALRTIRKEKP